MAINLSTLLGNLQSGTSVSASGAAIDFTGIPSNVKQIIVMLNGVSTNGTSIVQLQAGTSGGVVTSGYAACSSAIASVSVATIGVASGITLGENSTNTAASVRFAVFTLLNISGNTWNIIANGNLSNTPVTLLSSGSIALGATLDRVRLTTINGTDTFDAGSVNIIYQ
jgi:hypothetical protein